MKFPFSQNLFWDADMADIDLSRNKRYVIERILLRGGIDDFNKLQSLYTQEDIREVVMKSKELDPKTAHFCSWYFDIPESHLHASSFYR